MNNVISAILSLLLAFELYRAVPVIIKTLIFLVGSFGSDISFHFYFDSVVLG